MIAYACPAPDAPAQFVDGEIPDAPTGAAHASGTVVVRLNLRLDGSIGSSSIKSSSGNAVLDAAAVRGAKASTFTPRCAHGHAVAGTYLYVTTFGHPKPG